MNTDRNARLAGLLKRLRHAGTDRDPPFERFDATPAQVAVLEALAERPGSSQREVARSLGLSPSTVCVALWRLEALGLVNQEQNAQDARALSVEPSAKGLGLLAELKAFREEKTGSLLSSLTEREADTFLRLLEKLLGAVSGTARKTDTKEAET